MTVRSDTRFSADGSLAACLATGRTGPHAEVWDFTAAVPLPHLLSTPDGERGRTQLVPVPGRAALLVRHRPDRHDLVRLGPGPTGTLEQPLRTLDTSGLRLVAVPGAPALALGWDTPERTTVWRVLDRAPWLERVCAVPGRLLGGVPLDRHGRTLAFTLRDETDTAVVLDLVDAAVRPLLPHHRGSSHALLADPRSGLVVLALGDDSDGDDDSDDSGDDSGGLGGDGERSGRRFAYHRLRAGTTDVPDVLHAIEGPVRPLAVAPGGGCVALQVRRGARTHLLLHAVAADRLTEVTLPTGMIGEVGAWSATGLRFPYSSPTCPSAIATVTGSTGRWRLAGHDDAQHVPAHLEWFPCRDGDVEAVVHGDWRTAERVVVALHGGPDAAWDMGYHPTLQRLAASGCAVVAPNQRGSVGYGAEHAAAIRGAWGGPDRYDVCRIGRHLTRGRPGGARRPLLFGESYGAYLALLTAGHRPDLWSGCAAAAPFLSGDRLHAEASPTVRGLIDRLAGHGSADVLAVVGRLRGPLLVVHGDGDPTVPVSQSRVLRDHLDRRDRAPLEYVEVLGAGHDPIAASATARAALRRFLTA